MEKKVLGFGEKEAWRAHWNGHVLRVVNGARCQLLCDGSVIAEQKGLLATKVTLVGKADDKTIVAVIDGSSTAQTGGASVQVRFFICDQIGCEYGYTNKNGEFCLLSEQ